MNVKRFTGRTSRDALMLVRQAFGDDAVVVSTRPCPEGVEVLAMAPESVQQLERVAAQPAAQPAAPARRAPARQAAAASPRATPSVPEQDIEQDVEQLAMSTLSFQDYVRERMLKRREQELQAQAPQPAARREPTPVPAREALSAMSARESLNGRDKPAPRDMPMLRDAPMAHEDPQALPILASSLAAEPARRENQQPLLDELRSMRGLIEQRFGALAFMEKLQKQPRQAELSQRLLDIGFSPQLVRKLVDSLPEGVDPLAWAAGVLEHNLATGEQQPALEDQGGVFALIGSTGVGKTTSTAKLAAAFATKHGAANLGLVTLDAYRVAAHEQLRTYGRILGVPVHTAHDRASLEDLLDLLSAKKMVLIDTAGMAQRDTRTRELLEMLSHRAVNRLLVVNAAQQGETIEDVLVSYRAASCKGIVLSKIDEAVKLGPAVDAMIRHRLPVLGVANGQRVPEDWHRLSSHALVQRALRGGGSPAWKLDAGDVNLVFAGMPAVAAAAAAA
ncbi:flagellar biosynthesis protein FlhF [Rubrivivax albus]|uniref:Flagellar biosynthesis protein FlhF n=1 Tax=Rubrivivax albus TaxID=2499835 RepID=A0A3S2X486_9BURK|nr:flagellar biosynthesis protein FlhF [Rubrivivax albus]RVT54331.1 flagellar biosynthesis protein FlhF [Rubrivivax albus]